MIFNRSSITINTMHDPQHQQQHRLGTGMMVLTWLGLFIFLGLFFSAQLDKQNNPNQSAQTSLLEGGVKQLVLQRNRQGHYIASGHINNQPVVFMLDTGATDVSIPASIADSLNLPEGPAATYQTANGPVRVQLTRIQQISLGEISLNNVRATINPGYRGDEVLLGMSFLKHLEFTQRGDTLTLRQYPQR